MIDWDSEKNERSEVTPLASKETEALQTKKSQVKNMNEAIPHVVSRSTGHPERLLAKPELANLTCYNPGAETTEWVMRAAEDSSSSKELLSMLAENCNIAIRMAVADNQSTSIETLALLAHDRSDDLRYQLAENHNIDESILDVLLEDSNPYVAHRARRTLARIRCELANIMHPVFKVWTVLRSVKSLRAAT